MLHRPQPLGFSPPFTCATRSGDAVWYEAIDHHRQSPLLLGYYLFFLGLFHLGIHFEARLIGWMDGWMWVCYGAAGWGRCSVALLLTYCESCRHGKGLSGWLQYIVYHQWSCSWSRGSTCKFCESFITVETAYNVKSITYKVFEPQYALPE